MKSNKKIYALILLLPIWYLLYSNLEKLAHWITISALGFETGTHLAESIQFFIFEYPKVMLLLTLIIFFVGIVRSYFSAERTRKMLEGKSTLVGNVMASALGIVTPFCSCSAIPLFLGFVESGVPLGVTFSFLIAAPMINEIVIILLYGMFGWTVTLIYITTGLAIAITSGWLIGKLKLEHWVQDWVYQTQLAHENYVPEKLSFEKRMAYGRDALTEILRKVWIYVALGIAVGAGVHGYVPEYYLVSLMGKSAWYSVPLSILIGIPLYSNAAGIIPIVSVLIEKGASLGTSLAFMMSVIGLSLPEIIILKKVLKTPLIVTWVAIVASGIIIVGYLFNFLF